jgi:hypothetical protein
MEFVRTLNSFSLILFFSFAQWFIAILSFFFSSPRLALGAIKKNKQTVKQKKN